MVVALILGVVNDVPVPKDAPPVVAAYQLIIPALAVAPNVAVPFPHIATGAVAVTVGIVFTEAVTAVLVEVVHPLDVAST